MQQTGISPERPICLIGGWFWEKVLPPTLDIFEANKTISPEDRKRFVISDSPSEITRRMFDYKQRLLDERHQELFLHRQTSHRHRYRGGDVLDNRRFAGHVYQEMVAAFEQFLPHLRPGGFSIFGSARPKEDHEHYQTTVALAAALGEIIERENAQALRTFRGKANEFRSRAIMTGGGPGLMEAANRGARNVRAPSVGFSMRLPREQGCNPYIDDGFNFLFRHFFVRKFHFSHWSRLFVLAAVGGFGTLDELFEMAVQIQAGDKNKAPHVYAFNEGFWRPALQPFMDAALSAGFVAKKDADIIRYYSDMGNLVEDIERDTAMRRVV